MPLADVNAMLILIIHNSKVNQRFVVSLINYTISQSAVVCIYVISCGAKAGIFLLSLWKKNKKFMIFMRVKNNKKRIAEAKTHKQFSF